MSLKSSESMNGGNSHDSLFSAEFGKRGMLLQLNSGLFQKGRGACIAQNVSYSNEPITTMGGMTIVPDCLIDDIVVSDTADDHYY